MISHLDLFALKLFTVFTLNGVENKDNALLHRYRSRISRNITIFSRQFKNFDVNQFKDLRNSINTNIVTDDPNIL